MASLSLSEWTSFVGAAIALVTMIVAVLNFMRETRNKETEWLYRLYEKFYESAAYKGTRRILDNPKSADFARLMAEVAQDADSSAYEAFVDYLNFFEFICNLVKRGRMKREDADALFDYYLKNLSLHDQIQALCKRDGFEALSGEIARRRAKHG
jgi:hypothetical protein